MISLAKGRPGKFMPSGRFRHVSSSSERRPASRRGIRPFVDSLEGRTLLTATPTSISLSVSSTSLLYGQAESITATVTANPPSSVAPTGGQVVFMDGTNILGASQTLVNGTAEISGISLPVGKNVLTAIYGGTVAFGNSTTSTSPQSIINTVAGGDAGGLGTSSAISNPQVVAVDSAGDIFIADYGHNVICEVDHSTHAVTVYAGNGYPGTPGSSNGDNGLATSAELNGPIGIALDSAGDLFIADTGDNEIREVNEATGIITTVAGNGTAGASGNNGTGPGSGPPTDAELNGPEGVAVDQYGNIFIADTNNNEIRVVDGGAIYLFAGEFNGQYASPAGYNGLAGHAGSMELDAPEDVAVNQSDDVFIADSGNDLIREVAPDFQTFTTIAGTPHDSGFGGDGKTATSAILDFPDGLAVDSSGDVYIADAGNNRIREVTPGADGFLADGIINTVAGTSQTNYNGDGGPATSANLDFPAAVAVDSSGNLYIADSLNDRIRMVNSSRIISTVAGDGSSDYGGDNGPATEAALNNPFGIAVDSSGDIFIADSYNNRIREVNHATGQITTIAGDGAAAYAGDNGPAVDATLDSPIDLALSANGTQLYIADTDNNVIRKLNLVTGVITTVAGDGQAGYTGDNGPAITAELNSPYGVALDALGNLFIADTANNAIREVIESASTASALGLSVGDIVTVAGNGHAGYAGDNGLPTKAELDRPYGVTVDGSGDIFIADTFNNVIREVRVGVITTYAGTHGSGGYYGDGGLATEAALDVPNEVALDASGNLYIADAANDVIREVTRDNQFISTVAGNGTAPGFAGDGGLALSASMYYPDYVTVDSSGDIFIADARNGRIREVQSVIQAKTVTVGLAALTVTARSLSKAYGASLPTLTYTITGFVNGDTSSVVSGAPSITTTANALSRVSGSYIIQIGPGTLSAPGYTFDFVNGSMNITPIPLTIVANNISKLYGAADPALTATYSGFVDDDSPSSLITQPTLTTTATAASHVQPGGYPDIASGAFDPDYTISYQPGTLTVNPAPLTVTAHAASKAYGAAVPPLTDTITGLVNGDGPSTVFGAPTLTTTATASSGAGVYSVYVGIGSLSANDYVFHAADLIGSSLTVNPVPLTIVANSQTWVAGQAMPALSVSYNGFVNSDSPASLSVLPSVTTPANEFSAPGAYPIFVGGASSPNYTISYVGSTLTVLPGLVSVQGVSIQKIAVGRHKTEQVIVIYFSGALDEGDADNPGTFGLVTVAQGRKRSKGVALSSARYNSAADTVTLTTAKKLALSPPLRLTVNAGGLLDSLGRPLDGNGQPGGNFVATLTKAGATVDSSRAPGQAGANLGDVVDAVLGSGTGPLRDTVRQGGHGRR